MLEVARQEQSKALEKDYNYQQNGKGKKGPGRPRSATRGMVKNAYVRRKWNFVIQLQKQLEKYGTTKHLNELIEVRQAKTFAKVDWPKIEPKAVFKGDDGNTYYKRLNGDIIEIERLAEYLLDRINKKTGIVVIGEKDVPLEWKMVKQMKDEKVKMELKAKLENPVKNEIMREEDD